MDSNGSQPRVTVVDYGLGNLFSIGRAVTYCGGYAEVTSSPQIIRRAERLILPGVGAFGDGMNLLSSRGLVEPLVQFAQSGRPLLGICLGMQLLFGESEEFGLHKGLGLIAGKVTRLRNMSPAGECVKVPHVGWSELSLASPLLDWRSTILNSLLEGDAMYFVHSYVPFPNDSVSIAQFSYGGHTYCAAIQKGSVIGVQFHPEKSGEVGLQLLRHFLDWPNCSS